MLKEMEDRYSVDGRPREALNSLEIEILNESSYLERVMRKFVLGRVDSATLVEDLMQRTLYKAFKNQSQFRGDSELKTWLVKIAQNEFRDILRKEKSHPDFAVARYSEVENGVAQNGLEDVVDFEDLSPERILIARDLLAKIISLARKKLRGRSLEIFDENLKVFEMHFALGMKDEEIARELGMNRNTVKVKIFRVRQDLQEAMKSLEKSK